MEAPMPKTTLSFYLHIIAVAVIVFALGNFFYAHPEERAAASVSKDTAQKESVYDRVRRTGTIRCGYVIWPPLLIKDANTGNFSGSAYDYMNAIAKELDLKLEWVEETGWGNFYAGLEYDKFDVMCVPVWQSGQRTKIALLSRPIHYEPMYAVVRASDNRFDVSLDSINQPTVKVAVIDNDITHAVAKLRFPNSQIVPLSPMIDPGQYLTELSTNKADVILAGYANAKKYNDNNPNAAVKLAAKNQPVRLFGNSLAFKKGEYAIKAMIDDAVEALNTSGQAQEIVKKYNPNFLPIAPDYQLPTN